MKQVSPGEMHRFSQGKFLGKKAKKTIDKRRVLRYNNTRR